MRTAKSSISPNYRLMPTKQHTETCYERRTLDFDLLQDKRKRDKRKLLRTSTETGRDSLSSGRKLQCLPDGKHKTCRTALNVFPIESQM